ncbi:MAG: hypothetical protein GX605_02070, partial [Chloroflexi bacterium]|nr:hypothetical protein [Chloroflexota bacterium]
MTHAESEQSRSVSVGLAPVNNLEKTPFTLAQIIGLWVVAAIPMALLAWLVAPMVVNQIQIPAALVYWLTLMIGMVWQTAV